MKSKLEMTIEVLLPTSVTQVVEFPMFIRNIKEKKHLAVAIREEESRWAPFRIIEIAEYGDSRLRIYDKIGTDRDVAEIISYLHSESAFYISEQEFWGVYNDAINSYIDISTEFQKNNNNQ